LPWSNLSAAYFEIGDYSRSIQSGLRAFEIARAHDRSHGTSTTATAEQKLAPRLVKSYLHTRQFDSAGQWLDRLSECQAIPPEELTHYRKALEHAESVWHVFADEKKHRQQLQKRLTRYRPAL
jgi:hypothetical protein